MNENAKSIIKFVVCTIAGVMLSRLANDIYDEIHDRIIDKLGEKTNRKIGF